MLTKLLRNISRDNVT